MEVIKNAFVEGRETETDWNESNAKKDSIKLDVALENFSTMSSREKNALIPIHKICPDTGAVLATFPSRLAACRHIVTDILKNPSRNPISVSGNMEMCMRSGWKSYGFYWKIVENVDDAGQVMYIPPNKKKIFYSNGTHERVFDSRKDASSHFGVSSATLSYAVNNKGTPKEFLKGAILQPVNHIPTVIDVSSVAEAAEHAHCSYTIMYRIIKAGKPVNNYTYNVIKKVKSKTTKPASNFIPTGYDLFKDGKKIGSYITITEMAAKNQLHRQTINKKIVKGLPITRDGSLTVKTRYSVKSA